jgi:hypothetical protein
MEACSATRWAWGKHLQSSVKMKNIRLSHKVRSLPFYKQLSHMKGPYLVKKPRRWSLFPGAWLHSGMSQLSTQE